MGRDSAESDAQAEAHATFSNDELSREAIAAAMPELAMSTADLVGWVARDDHDPTANALAAEPARRVLAAALGVPEKSLSRMRDPDVLRAVERLRGLADQCRRLATRVTGDELTGALRRGAGLAALQREIDRTRRLGDAGLVVVFVDIDGLKRVNDVHGHAAGDLMLRVSVAAIRERLRSYDLVIRYGGDEFLCVLAGTTLANVERTAAKLRDHVLERTGNPISTGLAALEAEDTVDSLVARADAALYAGRRERGGSPSLVRASRPRQRSLGPSGM